MAAYMVFLVAEEVSMAICLRPLATAAMSRNSEGNMYVRISRPLPIAYSSDERKRHFFASQSNLRPLRLAQKMRAILPSASFSTQVVAAARPYQERHACIRTYL